MKVLDLLKTNLKDSELDQLSKEALITNLSRGRLLAFTLIGIEAVLIILDMGAAFAKVGAHFSYIQYLIMYALLIAVNALFLVCARAFKDIEQKNNRAKAQTLILFYITINMCWGSVVSLMDQRLYGQLMVFMVNMITCSVIFYMSNRSVLLPYLSSLLILFIGLPFAQQSSDVLVGHYVNSTLFVLISYLASRILYSSFCKDFKSRELLKKSNAMLKNEILHNSKMNIELMQANRRLQEITMVDELTGIPNRRSFNNYLDIAFEFFARENALLSIIMIDIDHFKEYNDHFGHIEGDKALIRVANAIYAEHRNSIDFVARIGGEEFIFAAFNTTDSEIKIIAERIRSSVYALKIPRTSARSAEVLTISLGTCTLRVAHRNDVNNVIRLADESMYRAKAGGRNRVESCMDSELSYAQ